MKSSRFRPIKFPRVVIGFLNRVREERTCQNLFDMSKIPLNLASYCWICQDLDKKIWPNLDEILLDLLRLQQDLARSNQRLLDTS